MSMLVDRARKSSGGRVQSGNGHVFTSVQQGQRPSHRFHRWPVHRRLKSLSDATGFWLKLFSKENRGSAEFAIGFNDKISRVSDADLFTIVEIIRANLTWRATDDAGEPVILKRLDPECLQHGRLHPNVKERLARIRELPLRDLAVLHGVDLFNGEAVLVWDDLPGETLERFLQHNSSPTLARDIALLVDALHGHGIVHGAIHSRNIIVDNTGRPRLTHLSPLLHYDLDVDRADLDKMLRELGLDATAPVTLETVERCALAKHAEQRIVLAGDGVGGRCDCGWYVDLSSGAIKAF